MLLGAETCSGEEAHRLGFVQRLGDLDAALGWADEIAALAPLTLAGAKLALNQLEMGVGRGDDPDVQAAWDRGVGERRPPGGHRRLPGAPPPGVPGALSAVRWLRSCWGAGG